MKFLSNKILALILLTISSSAFGDGWFFHNQTNKTVMVSMKLEGKGDARFWYLVTPGAQAEFTWINIISQCYNTIRLLEFDPVEAGKTNPQLSNLKPGAYGDNSPDYIKNYFDSTKTWQTPQIFSPKSAADIKKIDDALAAISQKQSINGKNIGAMISTTTGLPTSETQNVKRCITPVALSGTKFDIKSAKVKNSQTGKTEDHYILVDTQK